MSKTYVYAGPGTPVATENLTTWLQTHDNEKYRELSKLMDSTNKIKTRSEDGWVVCYISGLYAQCGTVVAHDWEASTDDSVVWDEHIKKLVEVCKGLNYSTIMVTMPSGSFHSEHLLRHFRTLHEFYNNRSSRTNCIFLKEIR